MSSKRALSSIHRSARFALVLLFLLALAVQGVIVQPVQAQATQLSVAVTPTTPLIAGQPNTATITVTALDASNNPVSGESIEIYLTPNVGNISPFPGTTGLDGTATFTYTPPASVASPTSVLLDVYIAPDYNVFNSSESIQVLPDVAIADELTLVANPATIVGNGSDSTTVTASVFDDGAPLNDDPVNFVTSLGLFDNNQQIITLRAPSVAGTNNVTASLTSLQAGTAIVTATSKFSNVLITSTVTVLPFAANASVTANPTSLTADGLTTSTITATLTQPNSVPFPANTVVTLTTTLGTFADTNTATTTVTTNASGVVTALLRSAQPGTATVTVIPTHGVTNTTTVTFTPIPLSVAISATPSTVPADDLSTATISVTTFVNGTPTAGQTVSFGTTLGTFSNGVATTNSSGVATTTLRSALDGTATVTVFYQTVTNTTSIVFTPLPTTVVITRSQAIIIGNGFDSSIITATVLSAANVPMPSVPVSFTTSFGDLSVITATTGANGTASSILTATSAVTVTATVTATVSPMVANSTTISITPSLTPEPPMIVTPAEGGFVNTLSPIITGTVTTGAGSIVEVFLGNSLTNLVCPPITVGLDNTWSCTPGTPFAEGPVTVRARVTDTLNNPPSSRSTRNFTVDVTAPVDPVILSPTAGATTGPRPTISGTATGEAGGTVTVTSDEGIICTAIVAADESWSCTLTADLPAGANTITATVTDQAGNTSSEATRSFTVNADAVTAPTFNPPLTVGIVRPTISGTADAAASITLTLTLLDSSTVTYVTTANAQGVWSVDLATATPVEGALPTAGLAEGTYPLIAQASNAVATTSPTTTATLRIDLTAPQPPVITNLVDNALLRGLTELLGTAEANSVIRISFAPTTADPTATNFPLIYLVTADAEGNWRLDLTTATPESGSLPLPIHVSLTVTATATDAVGNTSGATSRRFTIAAPIYMPLIFTFVNE